MITSKIIKGVNRHGIRVVPNEYANDGGIGDVDPLDKICFISNEWDSFRDDYRDGRHHFHSKSVMDYLLASKEGLMPKERIGYHIDTKNLNTIIHFIPIYYTRDKKRKGEVNSHGGLGKITKKQIPNDEREVTRAYLEPLVTKYDPKGKPGIRSPSHLNPALDRTAFKHQFIHWGRMLYYETVEGVNRWSENPFPHITTRGMALYLIDLTLRKTFSYNEARSILKGKHWD